MKLKGGTTTYGESIGILMLDTRFPRPPGDIGNALSFDFPVRYKVVRGARTERVMGRSPDPDLIAPFAQAARELEAEGVKAITTSCGFLSCFQQHIAGAVGVPVFTSALLQVPMIHLMLGGRRPIGIFTERAERLNEEHFRGAGWSQASIPVVVRGLKPEAAFTQVYIGDAEASDTTLLAAEMEEMAREFTAQCPEAGAIVLECTNMSPFASRIHAAAGLPVFDINTLIDWVHRSVAPRCYPPASGNLFFAGRRP
jgi:hypothetical protein